jgi:hypothetical protein
VQSCIASASQTPTFRNTAFGQYELTTTMSASSGDNYIYDVGSVAGIRPGDELRTNAFIASGTTVSSIGTITVNTMGSTPCSPTCDLSWITFPNTADYNRLRVGMAISDGPVDYSRVDSTPYNCTGG